MILLGLVAALEEVESRLSTHYQTMRVMTDLGTLWAFLCWR